jgi:hypothetical protein
MFIGAAVKLKILLSFDLLPFLGVLFMLIALLAVLTVVYLKALIDTTEL